MSRPLRPLTLLVCTALALSTSGCLFSRNQLNLVDFEKRISGLQKGSATVAELERRVGPPTSITPIRGKQLYVYAFSDAKTAGLTLIVLNLHKTNAGFDTALVLVGENGTVEDYTITNNSKDLPWEMWPFGD